MLFVIALAALSISTKFEGGSLGKIERVSETHYGCAVIGQTARITGIRASALWPRTGILRRLRIDGLSTIVCASSKWKELWSYLRRPSQRQPAQVQRGGKAYPLR